MKQRVSLAIAFVILELFGLRECKGEDRVQRRTIKWKGSKAIKQAEATVSSKLCRLKKRNSFQVESQLEENSNNQLGGVIDEVN